MSIENLNRARNAALAAVLAAGLSLPVTGLAYAAEEGSDEPEASDVKNRLDNLFSEEDQNVPTKSESVYVFTKADGSVKNTIVTDWLKNAEQAASLHDISSLTDIQNTEGKETFEAKGESLMWDAQGSDIYYQGNTDKQAPVKLKVTYWLDGQETAPEALLGKSGHVKIRFDYQNDSYTTEYVDGAARTVYTPFACVTGMILDNGVFKNIAVTNARAMNDGDRTMVGGVAFPGLQDDLGINRDTMDIPDYIELEADVTDFEMGTTATLVTSNLLDNLNTDELNTGEVSDALNQLSDATNKLIDGSSKLYDGMQQLDAGSDQLAAGATELADKTTNLPASAEALANGSNDLAEGLGNAVDGSQQLAAGNQQLVDGLNKLAPGLGDAATGSAQLQEGLEALKNGRDGQPGLAQASEMLDNLDLSSLGAIGEATAGFEEAATTLGDVKGQLETAVASIQDAGTKAQDLGQKSQEAGVAAQKAANALDNLSDEQKAAIGEETLGILKEAVTDSATAASKAGEVASGASDALTAVGTATEDANKAAGTVAASLQKVQEASANMPDFNKLNAQITALSSGLETAVQALGDETDPKTLIGGAAALNDGLSTAVAGIGSASDSATEQAKNKEQVTLLGGANDLNAGLGQLNTGLADAQNGANQLSDGLQQLNASVPALAGGITALQEGSAALATGIDAATDGSKQLTDGMKTFNQEGIQKLLDAYNENLGGLSDRLKATADAGKAYNTFTGKSDSMKGTVKFIYETDAIEA